MTARAGFHMSSLHIFLHHRYDTASCAPARRDVDRVAYPLARSFLRVASPGQYALSLWLFSCRCDSSYWDGRRPAGFLKGVSPALCSRAESGPCVCDAQSACLRGMRRTSICESVRFRLAYIIIGAALFPARPRAIPPASALPAAFPFSQFSLPPAADGTASAGVGIPA